MSLYFSSPPVSRLHLERYGEGLNHCNHFSLALAFGIAAKDGREQGDLVSIRGSPRCSPLGSRRVPSSGSKARHSFDFLSQSCETEPPSSHRELLSSATFESQADPLAPQFAVTATVHAIPYERTRQGSARTRFKDQKRAPVQRATRESKRSANLESSLSSCVLRSVPENQVHYFRAHQSEMYKCINQRRSTDLKKNEKRGWRGRKGGTSVGGRRRGGCSVRDGVYSSESEGLFRLVFLRNGGRILDLVHLGHLRAVVALDARVDELASKQLALPDVERGERTFMKRSPYSCGGTADIICCTTRPSQRNGASRGTTKRTLSYLRPRKKCSTFLTNV